MRFHNPAPVLFPYRMGSYSARLLARALGWRRVYADGRYRPRPGSPVVNWGASRMPTWNLGQCRVLNSPEAVALATSKLATFQSFAIHSVPTVAWTTERAESEGWLVEGYSVVARTILGGHSGQGIEIARPGDELPLAPLYTRYQKKKEEYRVHVFLGSVLDIQEKRLRKGFEPSPVRSYGKGYVFCREGIQAPDNLESVAIQAVQALGLDFGAVDILATKKGCLALEVNTAPGLEGTTLDSYVQAIQEWLG